MLLQTVNFLAALGAFCGIMCLAHKKKIGFVIFFGVELCMFYIGNMSHQYGVVAMSIIYFFSNIYAWLCWNREEKPIRLKNSRLKKYLEEQADKEIMRQKESSKNEFILALKTQKKLEGER